MTRGARFDRLAGLYAKVERVRAAERVIAAGELAVVERASVRESETAEALVRGSRAALIVGDSSEVAVLRSAGDAVASRRHMLAGLHAQRTSVLEQVAAVHAGSRLQARQMERLAEKAKMQIALESSRREQAEADDRFGSRLGWTASQITGR